MVAVQAVSEGLRWAVIEEDVPVVASSPGTSPSRRRRRAVPLLLALPATLLLSGCSVEEALRFGWPAGVTPQAEAMLDLWVGSVIAALVIGVLVWGLIFWAAIRYRKRGDELPTQTRYNLPIEVLYTVVPFLIIAVLFYYTAVVQTYVNEQSDDPDVTVSVVAFQWNWRFVYPDETVDGTDEPIETLGTSEEIPVLVVPTGQSIRFVETSVDVIHSFWVPEILFKRDVIPGRQNAFEIDSITREGAFVGRCAELCGSYHSNMNFEMRAVTPEKYERWVEAKQQGLSTAQALDAIGEEPFAVTTRPFLTDREASQAELLERES